MLLTKPAPGAVEGVPVHVTYVPQPGLLSLSLVNFLLNLATLFFYRFWARTRVRRHIWSSIHINGEPLEYTGTGKELFFGALIVFLGVILPLVLLAIGTALWLGPQHPAAGAIQLFATFLVLLLTGFAIYRARRYRLSRTLWRGIRFALAGRAWTYSLIYFGSLLLKGITLGWSTPAMNLELQKRVIRDMRFGDTSFGFGGAAGPLYRAYAVSWFGIIALTLLAIIAAGGLFAGIGELKQLLDPLGQSTDKLAIAGLAIVGLAGYLLYGIVWTIYQAREMTAFASYTSFGEARLRLNATVPSLAALWIGNLAILVLTLGAGSPFVLQRSARYFCDRLTIEGVVDVSSIRQATVPLDRRGEGLADAFDVGGL